jgi:hypothetical protein
MLLDEGGREVTVKIRRVTNFILVGFLFSAALGQWSSAEVQENHLADDVPRFVSQLLDRVVAKGLGEQEIASLIAIIRADEMDKPNG